MQDIHKEQLSSLLDHELELPEANELIEALKSDDELNKQLDRFALIRDALNEDVVVHQNSFLSSVQQALVDEPDTPTGAHWSRVIKPYIGLALAASLVLFTVVMFDIDAVGHMSESLPSSASVDIEQDEVLAYEELVFEELTAEDSASQDLAFEEFEEQERTFQVESSTRAKLVTFEK